MGDLKRFPLSNRDLRTRGLGATLGGGLKIKKTVFSFRNFFREKMIVSLLGFECSKNPQNLIKIVGAIFEKIKKIF